MTLQQITPVISTSAYASGDVVGTAGYYRVDGTNNQKGLITQVNVVDSDGESAPLDFFFFNAAPEGTYTDNAAFALAAADLDKRLGYKSVVASDYAAMGADSMATASPVNIILPPCESLYIIVVIRDAHTFTATSDLRFDIGILEYI